MKTNDNHILDKVIMPMLILAVSCLLLISCQTAGGVEDPVVGEKKDGG
jgi:hypothetical protein